MATVDCSGGATAKRVRLQSVGAEHPRATVGSALPARPVKHESDLDSAATAATDSLGHGVRSRGDELDNRGGTTLSRYLRDVASFPLMSAQEELETAMDIERAEVAHWLAILSCPAARHALDSLRRDLMTAEERGLNPTQLAEIRQMLERIEAHGEQARADQQEEYRTLCTLLARAIRSTDGDRLWISHAEAAVREFDRAAGVAAAPQAGLRFDAHAPRESAAHGAIREAAMRSRTVKERLVRSNLRLVVSIALRYRHGRLPLPDLIQEGNIGLMKAVERFDTARGCRLSTYACWWIRHAINRALADKGRVVRIPVHLQSVQGRIQRATQSELARGDGEPTVAELERETGISHDRLESARGGCMDAPYSLDQPVGDEDGPMLIDLVQDEKSPSPYDLLANAGANAVVQRLMTMLTPIESHIIRRRFGLDDEEEQTFREIGAEHSLSRERIRQLQEQALDKMRETMNRLTG